MQVNIREILCGIITELLFKRLIQNTKHKCKHFCNFWSQLFMNVEQELQRVLHDTSSQFVFRSTWTFFVIFQPLNIFFSPRRLYLRTSISVLNSYLLLFPFAHSICHSTSRTCKHSLSDCVTRIVRTFDSYCHTFKTAFYLNISISNSVDFALYLLIGLTVREFLY
jgi:hypothetical protein